jgi:hypothetical protein
VSFRWTDSGLPKKVNNLRKIPGYETCLAIASVVGAVIGWSFFPEPKAIDGALALAGIVNYPQDSVQGIYFHNMWTAIHQILGFFLWLGVDQILLSQIFTAALGAAFMSGLALVIYAITESVALSLPGALLIILSGLFVPGPDYPILFISNQSFGQIALALAVLCIGFLGNRRYCSAGLIAGLLPAFHPVIGCWMIGVSLSGSILVPAPFKADVTKLFKGLGAGLLVSAASFGWYWFHRYPIVVPIDPATFSAYMENWEAHRHIGYSPKTGAATVAILALLWLLFRWGRNLNKPGLVQTSAALMISAAGSWVLYEFVHYFHASLPSVVSGAMLGRLVDIHFVLAFPIMIGVLCYSRATVPLLLGLIVILAFRPSYTLFTLFYVVCLLAGLALNRIITNRRFAAQPYAIGKGRVASFIAIGAAASGASLFSIVTNPAPPCTDEILDNCYAPAVFQRVKNLEWPGLTVASAGLAQMAHRHGHKAVILGASGFDFIPYLPQTSAQVRDIIESVYGIDFHNPPPQFKNKGNLLAGMGKEYWAKLSRADWDSLATRFCVGAVIAPADWPIMLTPKLDMDGIKLYVIHEKPAPNCKMPS